MKNTCVIILIFCLVTAAYSRSKGKPVKAEPVPVDLTKFVLVTGGPYSMGSGTGIEPHEKPEHQVSVSSFYLGKYDVTFEDYDRYCDSMKLMKPGDMGWGRSFRPVIMVSWIDAISYCNWLSKKDHLVPCYMVNGNNIKWIDTSSGYRLPTEAEWEYAARGGNNSKRTVYAGAEKPGDVAWYTANSDQKTQPVGQKAPNELGLYDMDGDVWQWVWDIYDGSYYQYSPSENPKGPTEGLYRVMRGGAWYNNASYITVSSRQNNTPDFRQNSVGIRLVRNQK
jgi:sulfatase modifying factor 1